MSFIFQALPEHYDLTTRIRPGVKANWIASRFRDRMTRGEVVYFWLGGKPARRGLYGWGVISAEAPTVSAGRGGYRIEVEYRRNFLDHERHKHIPSELLQKDPVLANLLIFRLPMGTNFLLDEDEDRALRAVIARELGNEWLPADGTGGGGE